MDKEVTASESVLRALGIPREEYTKVKEEQRRKQEEAIRAAREEGVRLYDQLDQGTSSSQIKSVYLGNQLRIPLPDLTNVPDDPTSRVDRALQHLVEVFRLPAEKLSGAVQPDRPDNQRLIGPDDLRLRIRYVVEGFAAASIDRGWYMKSGFRAVNTVTPGGILENQYILDRVKEKAGGNPQTMVYFADAIQMAQTPQTPTPQ